MIAFLFHIYLCLLDHLQGTAVDQLGSPQDDPWLVTASLRSPLNQAGILEGNITVPFQNGWANFSDLAISHPGVGYIINFNVTYPSHAVSFATSLEVTISNRPIAVQVRPVTMIPIANQAVEFIVELMDGETMTSMDNIAWRVSDTYCKVNIPYLRSSSKDIYCPCTL